jgi:hypothetical protein
LKPWRKNCSLRGSTQNERGVGERALFDLGEGERKGEMRMRERETERKRPERIGEDNAHDDRSGIAG